MTYKTPALPQPPEFPASNASYNKIVDKMHKAALQASTAASAIAAVTMCKDAVTGVNTYSKKCRRYGDSLIEVLSGGDPVAAEVAAGTEVPDAETVDAAAAAGDPVAEFMLKGAKAQAAVDEAAPFGKTFSNKSNAKRALAKAQLDHMPVEWQPAPDGHVRPVLIGDTPKSLVYANDRGFAAKVPA